MNDRSFLYIGLIVVLVLLSLGSISVYKDYKKLVEHRERVRTSQITMSEVRKTIETIKNPTVEQLIIDLPEDGGKSYITVFTTPNWKTNSIEYWSVNWFYTNKKLSEIRGRAHFNHYTTDSAIYKQRFSGSITAFPCILIQDPSGRKIYKKSGENIPKTSDGLLSDMYKDLRVSSGINVAYTKAEKDLMKSGLTAEEIRKYELSGFKKEDQKKKSDLMNPAINERDNKDLFSNVVGFGGRRPRPCPPPTPAPTPTPDTNVPEYPVPLLPDSGEFEEEYEDNSMPIWFAVVAFVIGGVVALVSSIKKEVSV
jgi:hypothetical protein